MSKRWRQQSGDREKDQSTDSTWPQWNHRGPVTPARVVEKVGELEGVVAVERWKPESMGLNAYGTQGCEKLDWVTEWFPFVL